MFTVCPQKGYPWYRPPPFWMISRMSDYRFLSFLPGWRQENGFFVDSRDRIVFWAEKDGPGYVLSPSNAAKIAKRMDANRYFSGCALSLGFLVFFIVMTISQGVTTWLGFAIAIAYLAVIQLLDWRQQKFHSPAAFKADAEKLCSRKVLIPRPKPFKIRPSENLSGTPSSLTNRFFVILMLFLAGSAGLFGLLFWRVVSEHPYYIVVMFYSIGAVVWLYRELTRPSISTQNALYEMREDLIAATESM